MRHVICVDGGLGAGPHLVLSLTLHRLCRKHTSRFHRCENCKTDRRHWSILVPSPCCRTCACGRQSHQFRRTGARVAMGRFSCKNHLLSYLMNLPLLFGLGDATLVPPCSRKARALPCTRNAVRRPNVTRSYEFQFRKCICFQKARIKLHSTDGVHSELFHYGPGGMRLGN